VIIWIRKPEKHFGLFGNVKKAIFDFRQIPIRRKEGVVCPLFFA
jgi:hypothetical protein